MRKTLLIPLISLASCAFAQKSFFGVDAGINVANQRIKTSVGGLSGTPGSNTNFYNNLVRPTFSVFYHYNISEAIGLRANIRYMGLGYSMTKTAYIYNNNVTINYLTVPLSVHYAANKHFSLNAGIYLSFTLGGNFNNQDATKTFHKNDFGFNIGGEHDIYNNFSIGVAYVIGAKNVWLNDYGGSFVHTNRALQFTVIYKFKKTN